MLFWILLVSNVFILLIIHFTMKENMSPNGNNILGVKLHKAHWNDDRVKEIVGIYEKKRKKKIWIFLLLLLVGYPIRGYYSFTMLWFWIYIFGMIFVYTAELNRHSNMLVELKKTEGWNLPSEGVIRVDTEVSRKKNSFLVKWYYFLIPLGVIAVSSIYMMPMSIWSEGGISVFLMVITYLCGIILYIIYRNLPTVVYSEDTEINIAANRIYRHEWSKVWLVFSWSAIIYLPALFMPANELYFTDEIHLSMQIGYILLVSIFMPICVVIYLIRTQKKIKAEQEKIINNNENELDIEDDEYWTMFMYCNPHDKRVWVPKKVGIGLTINLGRTAGKIIMIGIAVATVGVIVWSTLIMMAADFFVPEMTLKKDTIIIEGIDDTLYIGLKEVESVKLITELPPTHRIKGSSTERVRAGDYRIRGIGNAKLEILLDVPLYIELELKDETYVYFNGQSEEITETYYQEITKER